MTLTKMSDLPRDLVEEIVSRVPLNHMRAVRMACKKWNALFQSKSFTKLNIAKEARELEVCRMMVFIDYSIHLMSVFVDENPSTKSLGKLTFLNDSEKVKVSQFYHCEGLLLLCILENDCIWKDNTKIVVWNPYLGQIRWIETSDNFSYREVFDWYEFALGYENTSGNRNPKILRFIDDFRIEPEKPAFLYEIYDFESDLWTSLDVCPQWVIYSMHGVSLKGNTYWGAVERKTYSPIDHIICFDFTSERFGPFLPLPFKAYSEFASLRQEKLVALFKTLDECYIEIWITTEVEPTQVSWSHFYTMNTPSCLDRRVTYYLRFFVDEEKKLVVFFDQRGTTVCNLTQGRVDFIASSLKLDVEEPGADYYWPFVRWPIVCSYVPSLVQIERGKRKTQSD